MPPPNSSDLMLSNLKALDHFWSQNRDFRGWAAKCCGSKELWQILWTISTPASWRAVGRKGSWECCRFMRTVGCVWCRVHSSSYWIPTSKDLFVLSIALGFAHCSYSRANSVRKVNRRHETCRTAWLFRQRIESAPLEIIVDSNWSEAGIPRQNALLRAKHAHTHTHASAMCTVHVNINIVRHHEIMYIIYVYMRVSFTHVCDFVIYIYMSYRVLIIYIIFYVILFYITLLY